MTMAGVISYVSSILGRSYASTLLQNFRHFHALPGAVNNTSLSQPIGQNIWSFNQVRGSHRTFRPNEHIRLTRLGWRVKMKTRDGRRQIMRRILKGRFVLTH